MSIKFVAGVVLGAAAGVAIVSFLNSEEGKKMISNFKKDAVKMEEELSDLAEDLIQKGRSFVDELQPKTEFA